VRAWLQRLRGHHFHFDGRALDERLPHIPAAAVVESLGCQASCSNHAATNVKGDVGGVHLRQLQLEQGHIVAGDIADEAQAEGGKGH